MKPTLTLITALLLAPLAALHAAEPVSIDLSKRTWQGIPGIERTTKGRVFASWFTGGPKEPSPDNTVVLSRSDDGGKTFSEPEAMALPQSDGTRCFDPNLWIDPKGSLWYLFNRGNKDTAKHDVWARICDDPDASPPVWGAEFRVGYDVPFAFRMNKVTVLSTGEWLMPVTLAEKPVLAWSTGYNDQQIPTLHGVGISTDEGRTWKLRGAVKSKPWALENMITELKDGRLWMLIRTSSGVLWQSYSTDKGRTWSEGMASTIKSPGSRFFIRRLASGNLLLVNHHNFTGRSHLTAQLSTDDGATWNDGLLLDERGGVSYPDGVQDKEGLIWITYDRDRGGAGDILLAKFNEEDVAAGKNVSGAVSLKQVISKLHKPSLLPMNWDAALAGDIVLQRLVKVTAPQVKGAHDAEFVCVGELAYVVSEANDLKGGESGDWPFIYSTLSIVNLKTLKTEQVIDFAKGEQAFANETLPVGACWVPRIIQKDPNTLRCYFVSQDPGKRQSQMWYRDFDLSRSEFAPTIHKAKLKTAAGTFDFQPQHFHADAAAHGFKKKASDAFFFVFDSFKKFDGKLYVALNNFTGQQNALALVHDDLATFEVLGHYNEPQSAALSESAVNRLPDGTWMAICRNDKGNYHFTTSQDGRTWGVGQPMPYVPNGLNSKPTFEKFGGFYYLGWQEATSIHGANRSVFNVDISRDGKTWERKYRFETPQSFQYPTFHEHEGAIWLCVTQGDKDASRKERIMFGKLEDVGQFESQEDKKRIAWPPPPPDGPAVMKRGVKLFTDRQYVIDEMPDAVRDLPFHRTSIEKTDVTVTKPGTLFALTPTIRPNAASQEAALQEAGFTKVDVPEVQLFPGEINRVSLYRKTVMPGEQLHFKKLVLLVLADGAVCVNHEGANAAASLKEAN
jgi:predicted neuraminidase